MNSKFCPITMILSIISLFYKLQQISDKNVDKPQETFSIINVYPQI